MAGGRVWQGGCAWWGVCTVNERAVRILLECIHVCFMNFAFALCEWILGVCTVKSESYDSSMYALT